ncbi:MAG TPA: DnaA regulatory inactivator Hda, partial [Candidatus Berkiella sp.]|nr:DnaA regulatory inactivator Hda [Candidatus Berkiella sp.]
CTLETYYPGDNEQALNSVKQIARGIGEPFIYLWGRQGVGRTHLLQGACHYANRFNRTAFYLSLAAPRAHIKMLDDLERIDLICIDDVDAKSGDPKWEEALFYLFNRVRAASHRLLMAADVAPKLLPIKLADLQSRLTWGITYQLHPLDDEQLLAALQLRAKQRGLELPREVGLFLIRRCVRTMPELYEMLASLDQASLVAKRRLTIPFVKEVLAL